MGANWTCAGCGGDSWKTAVVEHTLRVGSWEVREPAHLTVCSQCESIQPLRPEVLRHFQLKAAASLLLQGIRDGDVYRYARRALGFSIAEFAAALSAMCPDTKAEIWETVIKSREAYGLRTGDAFPSQCEFLAIVQLLHLHMTMPQLPDVRVRAAQPAHLEYLEAILELARRRAAAPGGALSQEEESGHATHLDKLWSMCTPEQRAQADAALKREDMKNRPGDEKRLRTPREAG